MFVKKQEACLMNSLEIQNIRKDMDLKGLNHEFFLLVRDKKYQQAFTLGTMYLEYHPENAAIAKFCYFIEHNRQALLQMVDQQMNYTDESDSEDEDDEQESQQQQEQKSVISEKSNKSLPSINQKSGQIAKVSRKSINSVTSKTSDKSLSNKQNAKSTKGQSVAPVWVPSSLYRNK